MARGLAGTALITAARLSIRQMASLDSTPSASAYNNPVPVAVSMVWLTDAAGRKTGMLGLYRGTAPGRGGLAFPGGYVDPLESIEQAAARELEEETGVVTAVEEWRLLQSHTTPANRVLVFCECSRMLPSDIVHRLAANAEALGFAVIDGAQPLVFPLHQKVALERLRAEGLVD